MELRSRHTALRRIKCYLIEMDVPDMELVFDEDGEVDFVDTERTICYAALGHGPEQAIRRATGDEPGRVHSIRRMRRGGLLRALLTPDDEGFDLHRGELEELAEQIQPDE